MDTFYFKQLFSHFTKQKDKEHYILDPFTCAVRLGLLGFLQEGTKISIFDNRISYCTPSFFQGTYRWTFGDKRDDLHNLYLPIRKYIGWYNLENKNIFNITRLAISGLLKLKKCYEPHTIISHSLELYLTSLQDAYNYAKKTIKSKQKNKNQEQTNIIPNPQPIFCESELNMEEKREMVINYKKFQDLYSEREIQIITDLLLEMEHSYNTGSENNMISLMNALDSILFSKEEKIYNLIKDTSTLLE